MERTFSLENSSVMIKQAFYRYFEKEKLIIKRDRIGSGSQAYLSKILTLLVFSSVGFVPKNCLLVASENISQLRNQVKRPS